MKKIFLIVDYSDTVDKQLRLINLIKSIKENGYEVAICSHIKLPIIVIDEVDYYFYDKNNDLSFDQELLLYKYYTTDFFTIKHKPLSFYSLHITAALHMLIPSLQYLKKIGYDIVHKIEYDVIIKNVSEFIENEKIIEKDDLDFVGFRKQQT